MLTFNHLFTTICRGGSIVVYYISIIYLEIIIYLRDIRDSLAYMIGDIGDVARLGG